MQAIFINCHSIERPAYYAKYYNAKGETYMRLESAIDSSSFDKDGEAIRIELYKNSTSNMIKPVLVNVIYRGH